MTRASMRRGLVALTLVLTACNGADEPLAGSPVVSPSPVATTAPPTPDPAAEVRAFVTDFMEARMARDPDRARTFLGPDAAAQYDAGDGGLTLIGASNPHFDAWSFAALEAADANSFEVRVQVVEAYTGEEETTSFEENLFVGPGPDVDGELRPFVVRGAQRL